MLEQKYVEKNKFGQIVVEGTYYKKKKHGEWIRYGRLGQIMEIKTYAAGILNGRYQFYYENGTVHEEGFYKIPELK